MRVATYNVRHCEGLDGVVDPHRTAAAIRATGADVVALQELDRNMERTDEIDQPALIEQLTGLTVRFWPTLRRGDGEYGIAVAAPHDFPASFRRLQARPREEPRGAIVAEVAGVSVIATHLSRGRGSRSAQLVQLAAIAQTLEGPKLLLGDLNEAPTGLQALAAVGLASDGRTHRTLHRSRRQIDHILAGGGAVVRATSVLHSRASDHRPLVADIDLP